MRRGCGLAGEYNLDPACNRIDHALARAPVRNMGHLDSGQIAEIFTQQVRPRPHAGRTVGHHARIGLGVGDQFLQRAKRRLGRQGHVLRRDGDLHNWREDLAHIEIHLVLEGGILEGAAGGVLYGVAIGWRLVRRLQCQNAAHTGGNIIHKKLRPPGFGHLARYQPRQGIRPATGCGPHDHPHRSGRVVAGQAGGLGGMSRAYSAGCKRKTGKTCLQQLCIDEQRHCVSSCLQEM